MAEAPWLIIKQEQRTGKLPDGSFGDVVRVTYRTAGGTVRWADIPAELYSADNVRAVLDSDAAETDATATLNVE